MENINLEKSIKRLDRDIDALRIASKYLSNKDEIKKVRDELNERRQKLADEYYANDGHSYIECCEMIRGLFGKKLGKAEQKELLMNIRNIYGRMAPNISKEANGLNVWLKAIGAEYQWKEVSEGEWAHLIISGLIPKNNDF